MAKIRIFSETKANLNMSSGMTWNNPAFYEYIEVPDDTDVSLMLELDYQDRLQNAKPDEVVVKFETLAEYMDAQNKENFNSWRSAHRHLAAVKSNENEDDPLENIADKSQFEEYAVEKMDDERLEAKVRIILSNKPEWAETVINIVCEDMPVKDYAAKVGKDPSGVGKMLKRALSKLKNKI